MGWQSTGPGGPESGAALALEPQALGSRGPVPSLMASEVNNRADGVR